MSKCVVVASGYFNPLHYGHVSFLQKARDAGTSLIVIVNNDAQTARKMSEHPGFVAYGQPARDRVRLVRSLACVDAAIEAVDEDESVAGTLRMLHPDVFANGGKQRATDKEASVCAELGIKMVIGLGVEMLILQPFTQHYDWGKPRSKSAVAALTGADAFNSPQVPSAKPYAELWMGDHPSGPSQVHSPSGGTPGCLIHTLQTSPYMLGEKLQEVKQLPFLMKVLSIHKALSIQAHPDRSLAAKLHAERPDVYKDANHKPEIAIALTDFEALCGFRPIPELVRLADAVPELSDAIGSPAMDGLRAAGGRAERGAAALKAAYCAVMRLPPARMDELLKGLVSRVRMPSPMDATDEVVLQTFRLIERLHDQFGNDIGLFSVFFLNIVRMGVGECLYMPQNTPHAYLSGDIVECMACSDNVVRGGLTPKFKDLDVLCEMLEYRGDVPPCIEPEQVEAGVLLYAHKELEEFQVTHVHMAAGSTRRHCFSGQGPALGFAFKGSGAVRISGESTPLKAGTVFLLAAGVDCDISAAEELDCFVACCPPQYFTRSKSRREAW